jgi:hypothetical protein
MPFRTQLGPLQQPSHKALFFSDGWQIAGHTALLKNLLQPEITFPRLVFILPEKSYIFRVIFYS